MSDDDVGVYDEVQPRSKSGSGAGGRGCDAEYNYDCYDMDAHIVLSKNSSSVTVKYQCPPDLRKANEGEVVNSVNGGTKAKKKQGGEGGDVIKAFELEDEALKCYNEIQEYVRMYGIPVFDKLAFPTLMREFFTPK